MAQALVAARSALNLGEVPIGAVIVKNGTVIATGHNQPRIDHDPTAHAEIMAIRRAAAILGTSRLIDCDLWVTLEPCAMCAGAISHARIKRLYYAATDAKGGAIESGPRLYAHATITHRPEVYSGICEDEAAELLRTFFKNRRG